MLFVVWRTLRFWASNGSSALFFLSYVFHIMNKYGGFLLRFRNGFCICCGRKRCNQKCLAKLAEDSGLFIAEYPYYKKSYTLDELRSLLKNTKI